jgi:dynein heavy chain 1, cytosolic
VGAWGCFDEFNRLEERILSAVSQQILTIQRGLQLRQPRIDFLGRSIRLNPALGIFVTMNPGYAGRSNLPDNLKQLFRAVAMVVPDRRLIAQVMLFSQGIATAEALAGRVVLLFQLCQEQLSAQAHYDFGLRALKSVLVRAGALKRAAMLETTTTATATNTSSSGSGDANAELERDVLLKSACSTMLPKLVSEDCVLFGALLAGVFPGCSVGRVEEAGVSIQLTVVCTVLCLNVLYSPSSNYVCRRAVISNQFATFECCMSCITRVRALCAIALSRSAATNALKLCTLITLPTS